MLKLLLFFLKMKQKMILYQTKFLKSIKQIKNFLKTNKLWKLIYLKGSTDMQQRVILKEGIYVTVPIPAVTPTGLVM